MPVEKPVGVNAMVFVDDVEKTGKFWNQTFGAKLAQHMEGPDGTWVHAGVQFGKSYVMFGPTSMATIGSEAEWRAWTAKPRYNAIQLYINVKNVKKVFETATAAGAKIEETLTDQFWGDRTFVTEDNNGLVVTFAETVKKVTPAQMRKAMAKMAQA